MDEQAFLNCAIFMKDHDLKQDIITNHESKNITFSVNVSSLSEAMEKLEENEVDLFIISEQEVETLPLLLKKFPHLKVVALIQEVKDKNISNAIVNGVCSLLIYPQACLAEQLQKVMDEGYYFPNEIMKTLVQYHKSVVILNEKKQRGEPEFRKPLHLLTRRECEVLQLLAEGKSNREVGDLLFISEKTVKNHVSNILMKLKVKDRTKAVLLAIKKSWVHVS
jgi:two-component system, NarL family, response regulator DegU